ncbi:hypothetical protein ABIB00_005993 [Bradyrhizobium sp. LB14.3]
MNTDQKVVVITGASGGLGEAIVDGYRSRDYHVVATSRSIAPSCDPGCLVIRGDIADPETGRRVIESALERFGRVDTLINTAGIFIPGAVREIHRTKLQRRSRDQSARLLLYHPARHQGDATAETRSRRPDHHDPSRIRQLERPCRSGVDNQGWSCRCDAGSRNRIRLPRHSGKCGGSRHDQDASSRSRDIRSRGIAAPSQAYG